MSRIPPVGDTVEVKPTSNIYTVLSAIAVLVTILALVVIWMKADELYGGLLEKGTSARSTR